MTINYDSNTLLNEVMPDVPGCPKEVAINAIRKAAIEFCEKSFVWVVNHAAINAVANQGKYPYVPTVYTAVVHPNNVWYNGLPLDPITSAELDSIYKKWTTEVGTPKYYIQDDSTGIILVPAPSASLTGGITLRVVIKPTRDSISVAAWIVEKYLETLAYGAKAKLFEIPKKPWSDAILHEHYETKFRHGIGAAQVQGEKGFTRAPLRTAIYF